MMKFGKLFLVGALLLVSLIDLASAARRDPSLLIRTDQNSTSATRPDPSLLIRTDQNSTSAARPDPSLLRTKLKWVPAVRLGELTESACLDKPKKTDSGFYVAVPHKVFKNGKACGKTLRVSCAEPYRDLGGPWQVCKSRKIFTVTVIDRVLDDPLEDDLFQLSNRAFWKLARDGVDSIRLVLH